MKDRRILLFAFLYFTMVINVYGLSFWVGEIVDQIDGIGDVDEGLRDRDPVHRGDRRHDRDPALLRPHGRAQGRGRRLPAARRGRVRRQSTLVSPVAAIPALAVGLFFLLGVHGVFWTMPAALLSGAAAAAGIALINSIGNIGGFAGPYLVGLVKDATDSTDGGLIVLAAILVIGAATAMKTAHDKELERPPETRTGRFERYQGARIDERMSSR